MTEIELNNFKISIVRFRTDLESNSGFYNNHELNEIKTNLEIIKREITRAQNKIEAILKGQSNPLF
jgi:hypothetical protein